MTEQAHQWARTILESEPPYTSTPGTAALRALLADLSLDQATFYGRYGVSQRTLLQRCQERLEVATTDRAWLATLFLFGLGVELSARMNLPDEPLPQESVSTIETLVRNTPDISTQLSRIYDLSGLDVDWPTLRFHRIGTTSLIFTIDSLGAPPARLVLKLSHVLFTAVGPIARATSGYAEEWAPIARDCPYIVTVHASGDGWILEDYLPGKTLREFVDAWREAPSGSNLDLVRDTVLPLLEALGSFHGAARAGHGDLCPSNILIQNRDGRDPLRRHTGSSPYIVRFIDMGRNLLASSSIGRVSATEYRFVAPEVLRMPPETEGVPLSADLYSVGHLIALCMGYEGDDGFFGLDARYFRDAPGMARVSARLIDTRPDKRLDYVRGHRAARASAAALDALADHLLMLVDLLRKIEDQDLTRRGGGTIVQSAIGSWPAVADAVRLLGRLRDKRINAPLSELLGPLRAVMAGATFALVIFLLAYTQLLELTWDPLGIGPILEHLGFDPHLQQENAELRLVGASFAVAAFQYSVRAFGGISFLAVDIPLRIRIASEVLLWTTCFVVLLGISCCLLGNPRLWPVASAIGLIVVALNNYVTGLARAHVRMALGTKQGLITAPHSGVMQRFEENDILAYWTPTLISYACLVTSLAVLAQLGRLRDWTVYAVAITVVNLVVFSYSQATRQGPKLRSNLAQFVIAGEAL